MEPTIGRVVHYNTPITEKRLISIPVAAVINKVEDDGRVCLTCFGAGGGVFYHNRVTEGVEPGQWCWPIKK